MCLWEYLVLGAGEVEELLALLVGGSGFVGGAGNRKDWGIVGGDWEVAVFHAAGELWKWLLLWVLLLLVTAAYPTLLDIPHKTVKTLHRILYHQIHILQIILSKIQSQFLAHLKQFLPHSLLQFFMMFGKILIKQLFLSLLRVLLDKPHIILSITSKIWRQVKALIDKLYLRVQRFFLF